MSQSDDNRDPAVSSDAPAPSEPAENSRRLRLSWGGATHHGRVRAANQDALFADRGLFVVADGMGGHRGGEVASQIAVRSMAGGRHATMDELVESVEASNRAVWDHSIEHPDLKGMGTTLTAIAVLGDGRPPQLGVVNVGDSRIYRWRERELQQLTDDHSYVAELIRRGQLSENDAATHPYRNMLTRAVGVAEDVDVDHWEIAPEAGDRFVLCSDGLVNELDDLEIRQAIGSIDDPARLARTLIDRANVAGGRDNVTVVVVFVEVDEVPPPVVAPPVDESAPVSEPTGVLPALDGADITEADTPVDVEALDAAAVDDEPDEGVGNEVAAATGVLAAEALDDAAASVTDSLSGLPDLGEGDTLDDVFGDADVATPTVDDDAPTVDVEAETEPNEIATTAAVAATASPFDAPGDDDLPDITARNDALSGYELPDLDGDGPLPWLSDGAEADPAEADPADEDEDESDDGGAGVIIAAGAAAAAASVTDVDAEQESTPVDTPPEPEPEPAPDFATTQQPAVAAPLIDVGGSPGVFDDEAVATDPNSTIVFTDPVAEVEPEPRTGWRAPVPVTWAALAAVVVGIIAVVGAMYAVGVYARGTYHVAFAGDEVVIYQGRSGGVLWFDPTLEEGSGIFRSQLADGTVADVEGVVEVSSLEAARTYVDGIRPPEPVAEPADETAATDGEDTDTSPDDTTTDTTATDSAAADTAGA